MESQNNYNQKPHKQKRALLIGSSFSAVPLFFELKKRQFHVTVCGKIKSDPCHQYADESLFLDYSIKEELLNAVETGSYDFIIPSCNDFAYMSATWVSKYQTFSGFDTLQTAEILHKKCKFREFTKTNNFSVPNMQKVTAGFVPDLQHLKPPLLVKPVDSFSGRGVTKLKSGHDALQAIKQAVESSRDKQALVEEFLEGSLHSHSAFIKNQDIAFDFFVDEFCTIYPYQVNCSNHPSNLFEDIRASIRQEICRMSQLLEATDGLIHTQFIVNGGRFWIIECMRRAPGDLFGLMIEKSTDINYHDLYIRPFIGESLPSNLATNNITPVGRHTISQTEEGILESFANHTPKSVSEVYPLKMTGNNISPAPYDKIGILFSKFESIGDMNKVVKEYADFININLRKRI